MTRATVIDGKKAAASVIEAVKAAAARLEAETGVKTGLAVVVGGDDPASHAYVGAKARMAKECGFTSIQHTLPAETTQEELAALVATLLLNANATVTTAHSCSKDIAGLARGADTLVAAVGRPEMVKADWVKPGATVIDVGINRVAAPERGDGKSRLVGDVAYAGAADVAGALHLLNGHAPVERAESIAALEGKVIDHDILAVPRQCDVANHSAVNIGRRVDIVGKNANLGINRHRQHFWKEHAFPEACVGHSRKDRYTVSHRAAYAIFA